MVFLDSGYFTEGKEGRGIDALTESIGSGDSREVPGLLEKEDGEGRGNYGGEYFLDFGGLVVFWWEKA
jgi:hypothetical protein